MSRGGVENAGVILDDADLDLVAGGYEIFLIDSDRLIMTNVPEPGHIMICSGS